VFADGGVSEMPLPGGKPWINTWKGPQFVVGGVLWLLSLLTSFLLCPLLPA
jgi:hypothetical protein